MSECMDPNCKFPVSHEPHGKIDPFVAAKDAELASLRSRLLSVEMEKEKLRLALEETITCCLDARNEPIEPHYSIGLKALEAVPSDPSLLLAVVEAAKKIVARAEKIDGPVEVHELFLALSAFEASRK